VTGSQSEARRRTGEPPRNKIQKKAWIKASAEVVFKALTDPEDLVRWFCHRASCDPREGGDLVAYWKTGKSSEKGRAIITRFIPGAALDLLWIDDGPGTPKEGSRHTTSYEIRSRSRLTEVVMVDADDPALDEETFAFFDQGWNGVLTELKEYCERRERALKRRPASKTLSGEEPSG
jgi:uncharacterized protein YndB with AHSA1/START domain